MSRTDAFVPENPGTTDPNANALLAMKIFLASWMLSFAALIGAYLYFRLGADVWPPDGAPRPPLGPTAASTAVAVISSVTLQRGLDALARGDRGSFSRGLVLTMALGVSFLALQLATGAAAMVRGLTPSLNAYAGLFWVTAVFHAVHVVVGLVALSYLWSRAHRTFSPRDLLPRLWGYYWHSVDLVWLCIFFTMFVPG